MEECALLFLFKNGTENTLPFSFFISLNIPPFVQARSVLEGLQPEIPPAEDASVKEETTDEKVNVTHSLIVKIH